MITELGQEHGSSGSHFTALALSYLGSCPTKVENLPNPFVAVEAEDVAAPNGVCLRAQSSV